MAGFACFSAIGCKGDDADPYDAGLIPPVGASVAEPGATPGDSGSPAAIASPFAPDAPLSTPPLTITPPEAPEVTVPTTDYVIQKGDSLSAIAEKFGTSVSTLHTINGLTSSLIRYGDTIKVPAPASGAATSPVPATGDSPDGPTTPAPTPGTPSTPSGDGGLPSLPPLERPNSGGSTTVPSGLGFGSGAAPSTPPTSDPDDGFQGLPPLPE